MIYIFAAAMAITGIVLARLIMEAASYYKDISRDWDDDDNFY